MRQVLRNWITDADTRHNLNQFRLQTQMPALDYQVGRGFDLYLSLVGELFDLLRDPPQDPRDWATLGNALSQAAARLDGTAHWDATLFSAASFYSGGYSASAYVTMRHASVDDRQPDIYQACYDFLARPPQATSIRVRALLDALASGATDDIERARTDSETAAAQALEEDPDEWVAQRIYASLLSRFSRTNLRSVLPEGRSSKWDPLIRSLLNRRQPVWDFFPSQIAAVESGLLTSVQPFSIQMPTGAGKTALTETLLFSHLIDRTENLAVLLVPYRALARELRSTVARRLTYLGLPTRTVYGGTIPSYEEAHDLNDVRAILATPEALTGLLGRVEGLLSRISLIVCDEGHLLDSPGRGVSLELLLARLLGRENRPRMVFISAIVPNIEEINAWLGGSDQSVIRSTFRPAEAEYAVLRPFGRGRAKRVGLEMQAVDTTLPAHTLSDFLNDADFRFMNSETGRRNTYGFNSIKTVAIAAARKSLSLGTVAVFAATKTGNQGVVGLAEEMLQQLDSNLPLPKPLDNVQDINHIDQVSEYLTREYGDQWVGTRTLRAGVVVHHGDIPQETREAVEELLVDGQVRMVLCTSTLAEGVNLPIRTLVLYSVHRRSHTGEAIPMLARDIRNLVGRAGRAGSSTKGLVICANPSHWGTIAPVAFEGPGEDVHGALLSLIERLQEAIRQNNLELSNALLESAPVLYPLTDGVDATLIELFHDDVGDDQFREIAATLAAHTLAARRLDQRAQDLLSEVFTARASRLSEKRAGGRLAWIRETGARARLVDSVVIELVPLLDDWGTIESPLNRDLLNAILTWAYQQPDFQQDLREAFPKEDRSTPLDLPDSNALLAIIHQWISGDSFADIAGTTNRTVDDTLRIHGRVVSYSLAMLIEQAVAVLQRHLEQAGQPVSEAVEYLPEYLRFGVATPIARTLMANGLRHRRAAVRLSNHPAMADIGISLRDPREIARDILTSEENWRNDLGEFVFDRTMHDLSENAG